MTASNGCVPWVNGEGRFRAANDGRPLNIDNGILTLAKATGNWQKEKHGECVHRVDRLASAMQAAVRHLQEQSRGGSAQVLERIRQKLLRKLALPSCIRSSQATMAIGCWSDGLARGGVPGAPGVPGSWRVDMPSPTLAHMASPDRFIPNAGGGW